MMKKIAFHTRILLMLLVIVGTTVSCREHRPVQLMPELLGSHPYFEELKNWYRKSRVYTDLDVRFYVEITYLSRPLLEAYVAEYARTYSLSIEEQQKLYEAQLSLFDKEHKDTFMISLFAPYQNWDRLDMSDDVWKLRANYFPSAEERRPISVEEVTSDDPKIHYFFPYAEAWARHFRVVVDADSNAQELSFKMQGVVGQREFKWTRPK
jgi:hypothetical protein